MELGDGSYLELQVNSGGRGESNSIEHETASFRIDGVPVDRKDLPREITAEIIEQLIDTSKRILHPSDRWGYGEDQE